MSRILTSLEKKEVSDIRDARVAKLTLELFELFTEQHGDCTCGKGKGVTEMRRKLNRIKKMMDFESIRELAANDAVKTQRLKRSISSLSGKSSRVLNIDESEDI